MRKDDEVAPASATNQNQGGLATEVALPVGELVGGGSETPCRDCRMTAMSQVRDVAFCDRLVNVPRKDIASVWTRSFPIAKEPTTFGEHFKKKRFGTGTVYRSLIDLERPCGQVISAAGTIWWLSAMTAIGCLRRNRWAVSGLVFLRCGSLPRGADVLCPGLGEDFLGAGDFL